VSSKRYPKCELETVCILCLRNIAIPGTDDTRRVCYVPEPAVSGSLSTETKHRVLCPSSVFELHKPDVENHTLKSVNRGR
jgi:hypothetical protein